MSRNSKNAKQHATAREQKRTKGFKGAAKTTPKHEKKLSNRSKYNRKDRMGPVGKGRNRSESQDSTAS